MASPNFSQQALARVLRQLPEATGYCVAYSGGRDSTVLLHAMAALRAQLNVPVRAVHVDHGLSPDSAAWSGHCRAQCAELGVDSRNLVIQAQAPPGVSREDAARNARYGALAEELGQGEALLTAHHQEDQAETVMLQLMRGCGPHGLAAIAPFVPFGRGVLLRPLLSFARRELATYAAHYDLFWIEDPSNFDTSYDRNFLRHQVMPVLAQRWPSAGKVLDRVARHQWELASLLDEIAADDLHHAATEHPALLRLDAVRNLASLRQRNVLRHWLRSLQLPLPTEKQLRHIQRDVLQAGEDREPLVCWQGAQVRRYRNRLYAGAPLARVDSETVLPWSVERPLNLPGDNGTLRVHHVVGEGLDLAKCRTHAVTVRYRRGGERCCLHRNGPEKSLKKLFQEYGIPGWIRERVPLIYLGDQLAAVAGFWVCAQARPAAGDPGLQVAWHHPAYACWMVDADGRVH